MFLVFANVNHIPRMNVKFFAIYSHNGRIAGDISRGIPLAEQRIVAGQLAKMGYPPVVDYVEMARNVLLARSADDLGVFADILSWTDPYFSSKTWAWKV